MLLIKNNTFKCDLRFGFSGQGSTETVWKKSVKAITFFTRLSITLVVKKYLNLKFKVNILGQMSFKSI